MCAHVFGDTSLPSCSNYVLRSTAVDNERQFGSEASDTLTRNSYVDDLLKSGNTVQEAVTLIRNVTGMYAAGVFNLTKFTSNRKEVLMAIPEAKRCKELKNQDLVSGGIPQERVLGINWNAEGDKLGFQVQLPEKPLTRHSVAILGRDQEKNCNLACLVPKEAQFYVL